MGGPDLQAEPDLGPDEGEFSLATYNVHDLFDTRDDPGEDLVLSPAKLREKLDLLAPVIRSLDADLIALQEVEHQELLDLLFDGRLGDMGYRELRLIEGDHIRGIDVAVASRLPLERVISHRDDRWVDDARSYFFSPDCLELRLFVGRRRVVVFINHLLSKLGGAQAEEVRQALGSRLRYLVDSTLEFFPNAAVAVVGDLNDLPGSTTLANTRGQGPGALVDLSELVPAAERYTYIYRGRRQVLDYILVTPELDGDVVVGSTRILHDESSRQASDHSPVVTRFAW